MALFEEYSMLYILKFLLTFLWHSYIIVKDQNKDCLNVMPEINTPPPHTYSTYMF